MSPRTEAGLIAAASRAREALDAKHGAAEAGRIARGAAQVLRYWRPEDGDPARLESFLREEFAPAGEALDGVFARLESALERSDGYFLSLVRDLRRGVDLDQGPLTPLDSRLAAWNPAAHAADDLFATGIAFVALLNFPVTTLDERLSRGLRWSRREWAETRLAGRFTARVPAAVHQAITLAETRAEQYIAGYNLHMHHLLTADGRRLFEPGLRLISHWGLRDELKARYADPQGLEKQRLIRRVMERIVRQEIPAAVVDDPAWDWTPETNAVAGAGETGAPGVREEDTRYRRWLEFFRAIRAEDAHQPDHPTHIHRRFEVDREIPETEVRGLFGAVLESDLAPRVAALLRGRLGRPLEPHDIWYAGFKPRGSVDERELDALCRARYPTAAAYAADMPRLFAKLGFRPERAAFLAAHIEVDPSRGAGHAVGAARRDDHAHLRTRVGAGGMDFKGFNIAVHEMGHNVEQVFSNTAIDHTLLRGVPNTAFTEAMAFVFQARDLELLDLSRPEEGDRTLGALDAFWTTREIAAVSLVDMDAWHWLYAHPEAEPAAFREAVVTIARETWNRHFAELLGERDVPLLAIYSHMVAAAMYTPDYAIGHLIACQIEGHFRRVAAAGGPHAIGDEFERLARLGSITPDAWMRGAVGEPISARPLLDEAREALGAAGG